MRRISYPESRIPSQYMNLDKNLLRQITTVRVLLALTVVYGLLIGVLIVLQALTLSQIIARVFLHGDTLDAVWNLMIGFLAIVTIRALLSWASDVTAFQAAARVKSDLRERVFNHLMALGPTYICGERTGELINTTVEGIEALEQYFSQYLPQLALAALLPLCILAFVLPIDLLSAIVLLLTGPLIPLFMILIGKAADALTRKQWKSLSFMSAHFLDVLQGLTALKMLGRSRDQIETIARVSDQFRTTTMGVLRVAFLSAFALEMIATISTAIVAVQVGLRLLYGQVQFEQAFFVLVLAPDFYLPLRLLGTRFHAGMSGVSAAARIFEILETPVGQESGVIARRGFCDEAISNCALGIASHKPLAMTIDAPLPPCPLAPLPITFNDVHYSYNRTRAALDGVSFAIAPGQQVALVGPTGSGKSTIVNLLLRFIAADQGEITCGGLPLREWSPHEWRAQIGWVPQTPYLFNDTVAANIRLAGPDAPLEDLVRAARFAHADEFIEALPQGYDTVIGERGARLSGGQAQRIALARAFLKDAPLLILDEAMSNLDVENAALIQEATDRLMQNRTTLMITHRLNSIAHADQIIVLTGGRVIECGTHAMLMHQLGTYYKLITAGRAPEIA